MVSAGSASSSSDPLVYRLISIISFKNISLCCFVFTAPLKEECSRIQPVLIAETRGKTIWRSVLLTVQKP
jgi:hypothetical protein